MEENVALRRSCCFYSSVSSSSPSSNSASFASSSTSSSSVSTWPPPPFPHPGPLPTSPSYRSHAAGDVVAAATTIFGSSSSSSSSSISSSSPSSSSVSSSSSRSCCRNNSLQNSSPYLLTYQANCSALPRANLVMAENTALYVINAVDSGIYLCVQRTQPDIFTMPAWFHVSRNDVKNPLPDPPVIERMDSYRNHGENCWICHTLHTILPIQSPTNIILEKLR